MSDDSDQELTGPDLAGEGAPSSDLPEGGTLLGHAHGKPVVVVRSEGKLSAIESSCSHYGGPLAEGLVDGGFIRCPWHHACFSLATGEAVRAPALNPLETYAVSERDGRVFVGAPAEKAPSPQPPAGAPESVLIIGGGAAGNAAAEMLRRQGFAGALTILSADDELPYDRPNLSKDYLAGKAPEDWIPLRAADFYAEHGIDLKLGQKATAIDRERREVTLADGTNLRYGALLLATGADPIRLTIPGSEKQHVHYLRSLGDSRSIIAAAESARRVVVIGASFIGLEVAASLVERRLEVHVVAPESLPMERILGREFGEFIQALHSEHGVNFHLGRTVASIQDGIVTLDDGSAVPADLVVVGVGVRPSTALAESAGLTINKGVVVDEFLQAAPGIWAAGDIARWPDPHTGERIRVEHWVVAERQGQAAALNILGKRQPFDAVPFFWSQHYDVPINYVGHAESWDDIEIKGSVADRDVVAAFRKGGKTLAVASIYRDHDSLLAELLMERGDQPSLTALTAG